MTISQAHSGTMGQESGEIWTAETLLQPILPTSDRLLVNEGAAESLELLGDGIDVIFCPAGMNPLTKRYQEGADSFFGYKSLFLREADMGANPVGPAQMVST